VSIKQGASTRLFRAARSAYAIRGPFVGFVFTGVRLCVDQNLENATISGSPPWTRPVDEQIIDVIHKGVYAPVTGYVSFLNPDFAVLIERPSQIRDVWIQ